MATQTAIPNEYPTLRTIKALLDDAFERWGDELASYGRATIGTEAEIDVLTRVEIRHPDYPFG